MEPGPTVRLLAASLTLATCHDAERAPVPDAPLHRESYALLESLPHGLHGTIAFQSDRFGRNRLMALRLPAGTVESLTDRPEDNDLQPAWDPSCGRIAFATTRFDHSTFDIAVLDVASGAVTPVVTGAPWERHPAWGPDGTWVVFSRQAESGEGVFRADLRAGEIVALPKKPARALMPAVSSTGVVAFVQATPESFQLGVVQPSSQTVAIVPRHGDVFDPSFSPDGREIAFTRVTPETAGIEVATLERAATAVAVEIPGVEAREPAWSPDGRYLAVAARAAAADAAWNLLLLDTVARRAAWLTRGPQSDREPAWCAGP